MKRSSFHFLSSLFISMLEIPVIPALPLSVPTLFHSSSRPPRLLSISSSFPLSNLPLRWRAACVNTWGTIRGDSFWIFLLLLLLFYWSNTTFQSRGGATGSKQITAGGAPIVLLMRFGAAILFEEAGAGQKKSAEWKTGKKEGGTDRERKKKR